MSALRKYKKVRNLVNRKFATASQSYHIENFSKVLVIIPEKGLENGNTNDVIETANNLNQLFQKLGILNGEHIPQKPIEKGNTSGFDFGAAQEKSYKKIDNYS